jgi:hypothetical protein
MDYSFESLRPGEVVIWNGQMAKQQRDAAIKPAPPLGDVSRPNVPIRKRARVRPLSGGARGRGGAGVCRIQARKRNQTVNHLI